MESHCTNAQHVVRVVYMRSYIITLIRRPLGVIRRVGYVLPPPDDDEGALQRTPFDAYIHAVHHIQTCLMQPAIYPTELRLIKLQWLGTPELNNWTRVRQPMEALTPLAKALLSVFVLESFRDIGCLIMHVVHVIIVT